jgi:hypothetical protein
MNIEQFVARHCFDTTHLGGGIFLHTGYAMELPSALRLPHGYQEMRDWATGQQRVFVSQKDQVIITLVDCDLTVLKIQDKEKFDAEFIKQSDYYIGFRRRQHRGAAALPYHAKYASCMV